MKGGGGAATRHWATDCSMENGVRDRDGGKEGGRVRGGGARQGGRVCEGGAATPHWATACSLEINRH